MAERIWHWRHWAVLVVTLLVIGNIALLQLSFPLADELSSDSSYFEYRRFGWPLHFVERTIDVDISLLPSGTLSVQSSHADNWLALRLVADVFCWLLIVASTWCALTRFASRQRMQMTLADLLAAIGVVSALLRIFQVRPTWFWPYFTPWYCRIVIVGALACTIYTAGWLAFRGAAWCLRRAWRKPGGGEDASVKPSVQTAMDATP